MENTLPKERNIVIHKKLIKTLESVIYIKLYTEDKLSLNQIAKQTNKPMTTIRRRLIEYGVYKERPKIQNKYIKELHGTLEHILYNKMYIDNGLATRDIAKDLGISQSQVRRKLDKYNIPTRQGKEARQTEVYKKKHKAHCESLKGTKSGTPGKIKKFFRTCIRCGKDFESNYNKTQLCGEECVRDHMSELLTNKIETTCDFCGKTIFKIPYNMENYKKHFCNLKCLGKWKSVNIVGEDSPSYKRIETKCGYCGKKLYVIPARYNHKGNNYCDTDCMANHFHKSGRFAGENSPTWTGGKLDPRKDYGVNWSRQRKLTRKRDSYTCQRCGKTEKQNKKECNEQLSVHHKKPFKKCKDYIEANKLENLISLCKECHTYVHSRENKQGNKEFINEG